jgi:hypothetical protein
MTPTKRILERKELEELLLGGTYIEPNDIETMRTMMKPRNMYIWMTTSEKNCNIKL